MAALRDQWQADRKRRQQETIQRRKAVQAELAGSEQVRQQKAIELQQNLAEHYEAVQAETSLYLTQVEQQRQAEARRTAAKLKEFDAELKDTVADMRMQNQQQLKKVQKYAAELRTVTQQALADHKSERAIRQRHQEKQLAKYVDDLEASVSDYLNEASQKRQTAAVRDRAQRHRDREVLTDQVQALRDDYAVHRQEMKRFRENLRQSVWGDNLPSGSALIEPPLTPERVFPNGYQSSAQPTVLPVTTQSTPIPHAAMPPVKLEMPIEEAVYDYLHTQTSGARLTEIEANLGINRFQVVDALRSLIQKELIVQKDRTYSVQEEAAL